MGRGFGIGAAVLLTGRIAAVDRDGTSRALAERDRANSAIAEASAVTGIENRFCTDVPPSDRRGGRSLLEPIDASSPRFTKMQQKPKAVLKKPRMFRGEMLDFSNTRRSRSEARH